MPQIDNKFSAFFMDTETAPGTSLTSLSPTIIIKEADAPYTKVVDGAAMTNAGDGEYVYIFADMSATKDYTYQINPNSVLAYITTGVTDKRMNYIDTNLSAIGARGGGGFAPVNMTGINTKLEQIYKQFESIPKEVDLTPIIDKISALEAQDTKSEDKDIKKALKAIALLEKKLESFIESEKNDNKDRDEIAREFAKQEMIDYDKKALENNMEMDIIEEIRKEFDLQENEEKIMELKEKQKEIESERQELDKEAKEIAKQLKKL